MTPVLYEKKKNQSSSENVSISKTTSKILDITYKQTYSAVTSFLFQ